jgi:hypothetical protein
VSSRIASAIVWFTLLKAVFAFLGWLSRDSADGALRTRLDRLFDWLDRLRPTSFGLRLDSFSDVFEAQHAGLS